MNELTPLNNDEFLEVYEELSISRLSQKEQSRLMLFIVPVALLLFLKKNPHILSTSPVGNHEKSTSFIKPSIAPLNNLDGSPLDKMVLLAEGIKKVNTIQELRKNLSKSKDTPVKLNKEIITEVIDLFGNGLNEDVKAQLHNVSHILTVLDKVKDVKKVFDIHKQLKAESPNDTSAQISGLIDAVKPILPEEIAKNVDNFKKMAQMMQMMSIFDASKQQEIEIEGDEE